MTTDSGILQYSEVTTAALVQGVLSHEVGSGTPVFGGPLTTDALDPVADMYLQVAVDSPGNVVMPRTRLLGVPFAAHAATSGHAATADAAITTTYVAVNEAKHFLRDFVVTGDQHVDAGDVVSFFRGGVMKGFIRNATFVKHALQAGDPQYVAVAQLSPERFIIA